MPEWLDILLKIIMIPIVFWPFTLIFGVIFILDRIDKQKEKERKTLLQEFAKTKNLSYHDNISFLPLAVMEHSLFNPKFHTIKSLNILSGLVDGIEFFIVDQKYKFYKETKLVSACILKKDFLNFPMFSLEKKTPNSEAIKRYFNIEGKDIIDDPAFTNKIYVNGDESELNSFFDERIKSIFMKRVLPQYKYAAFKECFLVFIDKRLSPTELMKLQNHSLQLLKALMNNKE